MKLFSKFKGKASLVFSTFISLFAVISGSVSTFAWFQAQANVNISSSNSSTSINVVNNFNVSFTVVHKYYTSNTSSGYNDSPALRYVDFDQVTNESLSLSGLHPTYKMTFMVDVTASSAISEIYLTLTGMNSSSAGVSSRRNILPSGNIAMANAIDIYTGFTTDTRNPSINSSEDCFNYSGGQSQYQLLHATSLTPSTTWRLYYTVKFSTDPSTLYAEYEDSEGTILLLNSRPSDYEDARYFRRSDYGDSNCYEGLAFSIPSLTISGEALS